MTFQLRPEITHLLRILLREPCRGKWAKPNWATYLCDKGVSLDLVTERRSIRRNSTLMYDLRRNLSSIFHCLCRVIQFKVVIDLHPQVRYLSNLVLSQDPQNNDLVTFVT